MQLKIQYNSDGIIFSVGPQQLEILVKTYNKIKSWKNTCAHTTTNSTTNNNIKYLI